MEENNINEEIVEVEEKEVEIVEKPKKKKESREIKVSLRTFITSILVVILMGASFFGGYKLGKYIYAEGELTTGFLMEQIEACSDLITAKDTITGTVHFEDGSIPVISKKSFTMMYVATVKAGINLKDVDIKVWGKSVTVLVPHAVINEKEITIDPNTLQFFDDSGSLFNHRNHEDVKEALKKAKKDAQAKIHKDELLEKADKQVKDVLRELLNFVQEEGYVLKIKYK